MLVKMIRILLPLAPIIISSFALQPKHLALPRRRQPTSLPSTNSKNIAAYGVGMDQNAMMEQDMIVAVDASDRTLGTAVLPPSFQNGLSKKAAHAFTTTHPRGIAHRAFSVFLFNEDNELLLTRRALSKITFPGVWTNTCCSHPIYGQFPNEVDDPDVDYPNFPGVKHAAIRKLQHELGISPTDVPIDNFKFLRRFHYWAADTVTYGKNAPWGEHEIDYVLFIKCNNEPPTLSVDPEEVDEVKYVSISELKHMFAQEKELGLLWSPWFKIIMEKGGFEWWENLEESLTPGSKFCTKEIHFFDPPEEHFAQYNLPEHGKNTGVLDSSNR